MITQDEVRRLFNYDPETGVVTRRAKTASNTKIGEVVGSLKISDSGKSYLIVRINYKLYRLHRIIWLYVTGEFPSEENDHEDGDGTNNKWSNLRSVTSLENRKNRRKYSSNASGISGVEWHKWLGKWRVRICTGEYRKCIGHYDNLFDAACARKSAERLYGYHKNHGSDRPL